ncbi:MAG: hypothetical protein ACFFDK_13050, partial [Promethearchaeota archaeon]
MKTNSKNINVAPLVEFSPETEERFIKARQKGTRQWILAHLFYKSNKYYVFTVLFLTILTVNLTSISMIVLGMAISDFLNGNNSNLMFYVEIILILGISAPILRLINSMLREVLAQRLERDVR